MQQVTEEELSQAFHRASQIAEQQAETASSQTVQKSQEAYLHAAEEMDIPRAVMLQALRENGILPLSTLHPGEIVFAPSADKAWYAASVVRMEGETSAVVAFLNGGQQSVASTDIRLLTLVPGLSVQFAYEVVVSEMRGLWHNGKVLAYNPALQQAEIAYGLTSYVVPLAKLRLQAQKQTSPLLLRPLLFRAVLIAGGTGAGVGFWIGHFLR